MRSPREAPQSGGTAEEGRPPKDGRRRGTEEGASAVGRPTTVSSRRGAAATGSCEGVRSGFCGSGRRLTEGRRQSGRVGLAAGGVWEGRISSRLVVVVVYFDWGFGDSVSARVGHGDGWSPESKGATDDRGGGVIGGGLGISVEMVMMTVVGNGFLLWCRKTIREEELSAG
ncbi:putative vegetative cell wall protein gp1-like isoform X3 [Iris pallida]|uniref:Vegetative cell wall protein gp1-like isoform X3 n=1 Tax=Iris pallida TaxID=29817 RepID=A0AAX6FZ38_IRIPA|nr:putative vegetative cell wall protein gp1-like isoform X3 [Iris pallida]